MKTPKAPTTQGPIHRHPPVWECTISEAEWVLYLKAINATRETGAEFLLGGAFGLAAYTGRCRNTKDLDLFVLPSEKDKVVDALTKAGFEDYHNTLAYDRGWIFRGTKDDVLVDVIWQTPNRRSEVDAAWFEKSRGITLRGEKLRVIPAEELLAIKLYVMQRDRCDWPDLINLLYTSGGSLDWKHVLSRLNGEKPLLAGLLHVFNWVAPRQALDLPAPVREQFHLHEPSPEELAMDPRDRVAMLDTRPWFAAFQPMDKLMQL